MKVGFIVEGEADKAVVESLARRLLPSGVELHTVRLGGKAALPTAYTSVLTLLAKNYDHVIVLFDTDSAIPEIVARQTQQVENTMREHGVADRTSVCPVVRTIEDWILDGAVHTMATRATVGEMRQAADRIDLHRLQERNGSFAEFARVLQSTTQNVPAGS